MGKKNRGDFSPQWTQPKISMPMISGMDRMNRTASTATATIAKPTIILSKLIAVAWKKS